MRRNKINERAIKIACYIFVSRYHAALGSKPAKGCFAPAARSTSSHSNFEHTRSQKTFISPFFFFFFSLPSVQQERHIFPLLSVFVGPRGSLFLIKTSPRWVAERERERDREATSGRVISLRIHLLNLAHPPPLSLGGNRG